MRCILYDLSHPAYGPFPAHKVDGRTGAVSVADAEPVAEGGTAAFPVRLARAAEAPVQVTWSTVDASAVAGEDYTAVTGAVLTFAPGETEKHAEVATVEDTRHEAPESFAVRLTAASGAGLDVTALTAVAAVADNDPEPVLAVGDATAAEGAAAVEFTVTLTPASALEATVAWATADGTAAAGADYAAAAGTLTFAPGETAKTIAVTLADDVADEDDETFTVTLDTPGTAVIGTATATGTVTDDDDPPALAFALARARVAEAGGSAGMTVSVANGVVFADDRTIELDLAGSAGAEDFTLAGPGGALAAPYRLTLTAGATSVSATLAAVDDAVYEGDETVQVSASHGGVAIGASHTVTITDEGDRAQVTRMANTSAVLVDNVVDRWPGVVLVVFDRAVDGLEAHEVEVVNALVTSVEHQYGGVRSIYRVGYVATGEAGERMTVHVPENVVDGGNAASSSEVDYWAVIEGTDATATLSTTAGEPVTGAFGVSLVFSTDICWDVEGANAEALVCARPETAHLVEADFEVAGGSVTDFLRTSVVLVNVPHDTFEVRLVPDADLEGTLVLVLPSGVAASADGGRTGGARLEVEVDTRAPRLQAATVSGAELTLSWHEAVAAAPAAGDFTVTVGGSAVAVSAVAVDGAKVVLTLAEAAESGDAVVLSYTPGTVPMADAAGNEAAALAGESVDAGVDARAPSVSAAEVRGAEVTVVYDEPLDEGSVPAPGDFAVTVDGAAAAVGAVRVSGASVVLTLAGAVQAGQAVVLGYTPGTAPIRDAGETDAVAFAGEAVVNHTPVTVPVLESAQVDGGSLALRYGEALDEGSVPSAGDFEVVVGRIRKADGDRVWSKARWWV